MSGILESQSLMHKTGTKSSTEFVIDIEEKGDK